MLLVIATATATVCCWLLLMYVCSSLLLLPIRGSLRAHPGTSLLLWLLLEKLLSLLRLCIYVLVGLISVIPLRCGELHPMNTWLSRLRRNITTILLLLFLRWLKLGLPVLLLSRLLLSHCINATWRSFVVCTTCRGPLARIHINFRKISWTLRDVVIIHSRRGSCSTWRSLLLLWHAHFGALVNLRSHKEVGLLVHSDAIVRGLCCHVSITVKVVQASVSDVSFGMEILLFFLIENNSVSAIHQMTSLLIGLELLFLLYVFLLLVRRPTVFTYAKNS